MDSEKPHCLVISHLSPNLSWPRVEGSAKQHKITTKLIRDKARSENYINKSSLSWHRNYVSFHCSTYKSFFIFFAFCLNRFRFAFYEFLNRLPSPEKNVFYVNKSNLPSSKSNGFQLLFLPLSRVAQTKKRSVKTNQSIIDRQIRGDLITGAFPNGGKIPTLQSCRFLGSS